MRDRVRLTQYAAGGGCACKLPAGQLEDLVRDLRGLDHPDLLVGLDDGDDACAVRIDTRGTGTATAILSTADFFTPMIDDPYAWGRIAGANALSDVYAMGGRPLFALNLVGWNTEALALEQLQELLAGANDIEAVPTAAGVTNGLNGLLTMVRTARRWRCRRVPARGLRTLPCRRECRVR